MRPLRWYLVMTMRLGCNLAKDHSGELCETTRECDKRKNNKAISINQENS